MTNNFTAFTTCLSHCFRQAPLSTEPADVLTAEYFDAVPLPRTVMDAVYAMMRDGALELPVEARYPLVEYKEAFKRDQGPRLGKVLLLA